MRQLFTFVLLLFCAVPFGISVAGCSKKTAAVFCNGSDSGPVVGQVAYINIQSPRLTGISLNQGEIGSTPSPSATDCKSNPASVTAYNYGSSNLSLVDVEPASGRLCAGTWNRNTGGGIPNFTVCTPASTNGIAYVTASAAGATSNAIPIFVHPIVTSIVLGPASTNCTTDPASNCVDITLPAGCVSGAPNPGAYPYYAGNACVSQGGAQSLAARTFAGVGSSQTNISCLTGPLVFSPQDAQVATIDQNGLVTARQPGSTLINANISQSSSSAGFFSTCPPKSIVLAPAGQTAAPAVPVHGAQNVQQNLVATILDVNNNPITNLSLTFQSTVPQTVPVAASIITPAFPGSATITASCQPPSCNPSPFNQIGLFGNGLTLTSNPVIINATGTGNSTVLYVASTGSLYIQPFDFTVASQTPATRLPYPPNSMVLSEDTSTIYMGSSNGLMTYSTFTNQLTGLVATLPGNVLAVSNDNSTIIVTDPVRQLTYLYLSAGSIQTEYGGVATHAAFSPDSQTVYITTTDNRLLVHSNFTGWTSVNLSTLAADVAVTIPHEGAYLAGPTTAAVTNCPTGVVSGANGQQTVANTFFPIADADLASTDRISATNDGKHIIGATAGGGKLVDLTLQLPTIPVNGQQQPAPCPAASANPTRQTFSHSTHQAPLAPAVPAAITGVLPTSDSAFTFLTYTGTGAVVPQYVPATQALTFIPLQTTPRGTPIAPVGGVISSDDQTLYIGSSGDNLVHLLTRGVSAFTDSTPPLNPALPALSGSGIATPNLLVQRPRKSSN